MVLCAMKMSLERGALDQEIINEQLPADVDRDHIGRIDEIRRGDCAVGKAAAVRRPRRGKANAVVNRLAGRLCLRPRRERQTGGARDRRFHEGAAIDASQVSRAHE
ncbi:MAG: hypothetical protein DMF96_22325 [Acidobacteria bacterium]|nr:MAG: hypothetical protein DMF96_22325 [Acidobacteriota bacterium]